MSKMLSSWKEIAHFFGKGVRTVQRWEKTLNLPIRRPPGAPSNVVLARTSDLEAWMHRGPGKAALADESPQATDAVDQDVSLLQELETEIHALIVHAGGRVNHETGSDSGTVAERMRRLLEECRTSGVAAEKADHGLRKVA